MFKINEKKSLKKIIQFEHGKWVKMLSFPWARQFSILRPEIISEFRADIKHIKHCGRRKFMVSVPIIFCWQANGHLLELSTHDITFKTNVRHSHKPFKSICLHTHQIKKRQRRFILRISTIRKIKEKKNW